MRLCIIATVLLYVIGPAVAKSESMPGCVELLQERCQSCHYLGRVCRQVGEKSKRGWKATLKRMVKRHEAKISKEEQEFLLDCLAPPAPDVKKECEKQTGP
jgi:predicted secreted protein